MSEFLLIVLIFVGIRYVNKTNANIEELKKEIKKLKIENSILKGNVKEEELEEKQVEISNPRQTIPSKNSVSRQTIPSRQTIFSENVNERKVLTEEEKLKLKIKREAEERERKNTTILITGSLLIVLAAIVFLMSTWNSVSNIVKTAVLVLLIGVFWGASKIAKEKFKLDKTSNTFFYLAMAYIPICLISCSVFGLFGDYFSIYGEGRYTYLALSMLFTSGIYYINYKIKASQPLLYGSVLSQICSVILFGLVFSKDILLILIMLLIYNIALILLTKNSDIDLLKYFYYGIPYITGIISMLSLFTTTSYLLVIIPLLTINYFLLYVKKGKNHLNAYLFNITLNILGIYLCIIYDFGFEVNNGIKVVFWIIYALSILISEGILLRKDNNLIKSAMIMSMVSVGISYFYTIVEETDFIKTYMISAVETLLMIGIFVHSKKEGKGKKVLSYLIPSTLLITIWHILEVLQAEYQLYIVSSLIVFVIGEFINGKEFKLLQKGFLVISNINIVFTYLLCAFEYECEISDDVIWFIFLELVYLYSFLKNREYIIFKYLSYTVTGFILLTGINFLGISEDLILLIPMIITLVVLILEENFKKIKDDFSTIFISVLSIISYITLRDLDGVKVIVVGLLFSSYLIYNNFKNNDNKYLKIIPMVGFLDNIFNSSINSDTTLMFLLLSTLAITSISIYQKKISVETVFSGIYLLVSFDYFNNEYIRQILLMVWAFSHMYFMQSDKVKDVFKTILYIAIYLLYTSLIGEFDMDNMYCWYGIGITVLAVMFFKTILTKYVAYMDNLEYITYTLIYIFSIFSYVSEVDGIIFVLFIVGLVMYSYIKKYGTLFIISIFAIIGNAILLTREFWLSVPWWIYLLLVGGLLIGFAVKNESDEKNQKINVGNVIKNLKDKIEK